MDFALGEHRKNRRTDPATILTPDANGKMIERRTVHFAGHVQGVGFRYTAVSVARRYAVTGYVQNLPDGRVVMVAEGEGTELDRFLADLRTTMQSYIRGTQSDSAPPTGEFRGFQVRY